MNNYKISKDTLAIVPINDNKTKIYEENNVIIVTENSQKLIEENCIYYGSSYQGRKKGTVDLIGITHKSPIIIEETNGIIFFPTSSPRLKSCSWICLNNLNTYIKEKESCKLVFNNNISISLPVSKKIIENQVFRATRLESVHNKRKKEFKIKNN